MDARLEKLKEEEEEKAKRMLPELMEKVNDTLEALVLDIGSSLQSPCWCCPC